MKVDAFDFELPRRFIASRPASPRDSARLLVVGEGLDERRVRDLPGLLEPGDMVVWNDTRVTPARLRGRRGQAEVEVTLLEELGPGRWRALARPARRLRPGDEIRFGADLTAEIVDKGEGGEVGLRFAIGAGALHEALARHGEMPLPPYILRHRAPDARDRRDYQTVYAARAGAVAAPTAGLHFTRRLIARLTARGVGQAAVTLHVGAGTFRPVKAADTEHHRMEPERGVVSQHTATAINRARRQGGRIVAVGTTTLRLLESAADEGGAVHPFAGETALFITPGYRFRTAELLLSNFHLPRSTLFMLVSAFAGLERMKEAYAHAKRAGYRFYSYGDCTLLRRAQA